MKASYKHVNDVGQGGDGGIAAQFGTFCHRHSAFSVRRAVSVAGT